RELMKTVNKRSILAIIFALAMMLAGSLAFAQSSDKNLASGDQAERAGWHHHGMGMLFSQLNLTDAQQAQIKQIMQSHRDTMQQLKSQLRSQEQSMHASMQQGT